MLPQLNKYKGYDDYQEWEVRRVYKEFLDNPDVPEDIKKIIKDEYNRDIPAEIDDADSKYTYYEERRDRIYHAKYLDPKIDYINSGDTLEVKKFKDWVKLNKSMEKFKKQLNDSEYKTGEVDMRAQLQKLICTVKDRKYNVLCAINRIGYATLRHITRFNTLSNDREYYSSPEAKWPDFSYEDELKFVIEMVLENESKWKALLEYNDRVQNIIGELQKNLNEL